MKFVIKINVTIERQRHIKVLNRSNIAKIIKKKIIINEKTFSFN